MTWDAQCIEVVSRAGRVLVNPPTLPYEGSVDLVITPGADYKREERGRDGGRRGDWSGEMNKSVASNFLHKQHSQVSKQRIQGLFIDV